MALIQSNIGTNVSVKDGVLTTHRFQDCNPIAEHAKALHNMGMFGSSDMKLAATIPDVMIEKYCNDHGILFSEFMQNKEHMRRVLNDPAMAHFRVWPGKI